jgi:F420H(2)-dependent quinone reductase
LNGLVHEDAVAIFCFKGENRMPENAGTVGRRPSRLSVAAQNLITAVHVFIYRATNGALGGRVLNSPVLLLTTRGRRSGKDRTVPLLYLADGDDVVLVASNGGAVRSPAWWLNLEAHPEAHIQVKDVRRQVRVVRATVEEKQRLWPLLTAMYSGYKQYQEITDRDIPVAICR